VSLHRNRSLLIYAIVNNVVALALLTAELVGPHIEAAVVILALLAMAIGFALIRVAMTPFSFEIGPDGLKVRDRGLNRRWDWSLIEKILLVPGTVGVTERPRQPAQLLLIPMAGVKLGVPLTERSPTDRRACLLLLDFRRVREQPAAVADALRGYCRQRFSELRDEDLLARPLTVVLRGYDFAAVDQLRARVRTTLRSGSADQRATVRTALATASLPVTWRGYDRTQVDELLPRLAERLAPNGHPDVAPGR
jgi:hypothetical protein